MEIFLLRFCCLSNHTHIQHTCWMQGELQGVQLYQHHSWGIGLGNFFKIPDWESNSPRISPVLVPLKWMENEQEAAIMLLPTWDCL